MTTKKQIRANRRNARRGGPRTPEGKARSRLNARKHGALSTVLTEDDVAKLRGLYDGFAESIRPVGGAEEMVVLGIARA